MVRKNSVQDAESCFSHNEDARQMAASETDGCPSPSTSTSLHKPQSPNIGAAVTTNLRRFYGMGNAAVGGLIDFGAKYGRSFDDTYDEFEDRRFFDSRDYRCCFSIFHAKIGTFIFCTLILHEIVLGTIYLLTQIENSTVNTSRMVALLICRLLQFPPMALLYVALWRHQRWLLLPFAVSQLTLGAFTDISTLAMIVEYMESSDSFILFGGDLKWLNMVIPLTLYTLIAVCLMWVLYKCFLFLHARKQHDQQRKVDKQKEQETLLMCASPDTTVDPSQQMKLPDEVMIITTHEQFKPKSANDEAASVSSEQRQELQRRQFENNFARNNQLQNRYSSCQNNFFSRFSGSGHLRTGSIDTPTMNVAMSALVLDKVQGDDGLGGVRPSTLPPPPHAIQKFSSLKTQKQLVQPRKRLISDMASNNERANAEFRALMLQHSNPRSSHLRGFRGSAYSLQDYLKFHLNMEKASSATPTMLSDRLAQTRPISINSDANPDIETQPTSSCSSSVQSLTLIEPNPVAFTDTPAAGLSMSSVARTSSNPVKTERNNNLNVSNENNGEQTPRALAVNPFSFSTDSDKTPTVDFKQHPLVNANEDSR